MAQRSATLLASNEADTQLAILSIPTKQLQGNRAAAVTYSVYHEKFLKFPIP
jgi:hypothetical protein